MKKVGMILDGHYPPDVRVENEALVLIEQGWEVHLLCLQYGKDLPQEEVRKGIKVHRISCHPLIRKNICPSLHLTHLSLVFCKAYQKIYRNI